RPPHSPLFPYTTLFRSLPLEAKVAHATGAEDELVGALLIDDPSRTKPFTPHEVELLRSFARHASLALARLGDRKRLSKRTSRLRSEEHTSELQSRSDLV